MFQLKPLAALLGGLLLLQPLHAADDKPAETADASASKEAPKDAAKDAGDNRLKPFADIIKGAKRHDGLFPIWEKGDKFWLELDPKQLDQPFFFTVNRSHGIGERGIYSHQMGQAYVASFKRIGERIQLIAQNLRYMAPAGTPQAYAVEQGFSGSLLAAANVLSQPGRDNKAILIDANALLLSDIGFGAYQLESTFRLPYSFDRSQSSIAKVRSDRNLSSVQVNAHYAVPKLSPPPLPGPGSSLPQVARPQTLPDLRSLFMGYHYSFARLPEPMSARLADDRVGHFATQRWNFGEDATAHPRSYFVNRWRLEKADPTAALSEPKQPIVYWLNRNIPLQYRQAVTEGVLEWNKAFERIGFKNAVVVKQQENDADFDVADAGHASVSWYFGVDTGSAVGPSKTDPRTGEILDADIIISDGFARGAHRFVKEEQPRRRAHGHEHCDYANEAAGELSFGLELLAERGEFAAGSPQETTFVNDTVRDVVMHEVGHTLGLRHNFRASTVYNDSQLSDKAFTAKHGVAASVMDYTPINLALQGKPQGEYRMLTLGEYDYWAIEYAYKPIAPEQESTELAAIAGRSSEPALAFATDEDAGYGEDGFDPAVSRFDHTADPLTYFERRIKLSQELWQRMQNRQLKPGESYAVLLRNFEGGLRQIKRVAELATKYVGGMSHLRDHAGSNRMPLTNTPAAEQRRALNLLSSTVFMPNSFKQPADFMRRLVPDYLDRRDTEQDVDFDLAGQVGKLQSGVLARLLDEEVARRMLASSLRADAASKPLSLAELYESLQKSIWQEAATGSEADLLRRNLQRIHLKFLVQNLTKPGKQPFDAISLSRESARELSSQLLRASQKASLSRESRAHYADALATLQEALKASFSRS